MYKTFNFYRPSFDEICCLIGRLNSEIPDGYEIIMGTNGLEITITILDFIIWSTNDDDRKHYEENDTYEDFQTYLVNKAKEVISKMISNLETTKNTLR